MLDDGNARGEQERMCRSLTVGADLATPGGPAVGSRLRLLAALIAGAIAGGITYAQAPRLAPLIPLVPLACAIGIATSTRPGMAAAQHDPSNSG